MDDMMKNRVLVKGFILHAGSLNRELNQSRDRKYSFQDQTESFCVNMLRYAGSCRFMRSGIFVGE